MQSIDKLKASNTPVQECIDAAPDSVCFQWFLIGKMQTGKDLLKNDLKNTA
jgi:hypothetical protein